MKVWVFFQPTIHKIIVFFLILLLWVVPTWKVATCKICWEQYHGFPITFIVLNSTGFYSPYYYSLDSFSISAFLIDVITLYLLSCVIAFIPYYPFTKKN